MKKRTAMGMALAMSAVLAGAQNAAPTGPDPAITLSDAVQASIARSASVKEAEAVYRAAVARTGQDRSRKLPQLVFGASATRFDNRTTVTFPGSGAVFEVAPNNQEALTLALAQDLDVSGGFGLAVARDRIQAASAQYRLRAVTFDQVLSTTLAYYAELRATQNLRVAAAARDAYREQQAAASRLYKGGVGQRIDVYRADSQVAEAESEVVRRQNELAEARSALNDLIGRPLDADTVPADPSSDQGSEPTPSEPRPTLIDRAIARRPEALQASVDVLAARKGIQIARTTSAPAVILSLSGSHYPTTSFEQPRQNVAAASITLTVPVFDGGLARDKVAEAKDVVAEAEARQDRVRRDIALEVQNASLDVETALRRETAADAGLAAAVAARRLAQQRFESQVGLYIEVTDAQSALTAAQAAKVDATYDLLTARARLAHAVGTVQAGM